MGYWAKIFWVWGTFGEKISGTIVLHQFRFWPYGVKTYSDILGSKSVGHPVAPPGVICQEGVFWGGKRLSREFLPPLDNFLEAQVLIFTGSWPAFLGNFDGGQHALYNCGLGNKSTSDVAGQKYVGCQWGRPHKWGVYLWPTV